MYRRTRARIGRVMNMRAAPRACSLERLRDLSVVHNESVNDAFLPLAAAHGLYAAVVMPVAEVCLGPVVHKLALRGEKRSQDCRSTPSSRACTLAQSSGQ